MGLAKNSSKVLAAAHLVGLGIRFLFMFYLLKAGQSSALGLYSLIGALEAVIPYLLGFELHTFTSRRYIKNPTQGKLSVIASFHFTSLLITTPLGGGVAWAAMHTLDATRSTSLIVGSAMLVMCGMVLQETTRVTVILKKPEASVYLSLVRSCAWQPVAVLMIAVTSIDPALAIITCWVIFSLCALAWSIKIIGLARCPRISWRWKYVQRAIFLSKDYYLVAVAGTLLQNLDRLLLQIALGLDSVAVYAFIQSLASSVNGAVQSAVINKRTMHVFEAVVTGRAAVIDAVTSAAKKSVLMGILVSALILLVFYPLAKLTGKAAILEHATALSILLVSQIITLAAQPFHLAMYAMHMDRGLRNIMILGLLTSPPLILIGSTAGGISGIALATLTGALLVGGLKVKRILTTC